MRYALSGDCRLAARVGSQNSIAMKVISVTPTQSFDTKKNHGHKRSAASIPLQLKCSAVTLETDRACDVECGCRDVSRCTRNRIHIKGAALGVDEPAGAAGKGPPDNRLSGARIEFSCKGDKKRVAISRTERTGTRRGKNAWLARNWCEDGIRVASTIAR